MAVIRQRVVALNGEQAEFVQGSHLVVLGSYRGQVKVGGMDREVAGKRIMWQVRSLPRAAQNWVKSTDVHVGGGKSKVRDQSQLTVIGKWSAEANPWQPI
jgi:hypothetical protein